MKKILQWTIVLPIIAWVLYFLKLDLNNTFFLLISIVLLMVSVMAAVHHSEVIAHKIGEPFGTIILAVAVTVIEVSLIISLMLSGGEKAIYLARDTVFSAVMIILNAIIGACILVGSARHFEQFFKNKSVNTAMVSLVAILVFTLILPNFTTSIEEPRYTEIQLVFVALSCIVIYGAFLVVQTIRHREYFVSDNKIHEQHNNHVPNQSMLFSIIFLVICLGIVVLLAKSLSPTIENMVITFNLPQSLVGVIIAGVVLLPEGIAAIKAANRNDIQTSLNLSFGSALAAIGLTIPSVAVVSNLYDLNIILGLDLKSMVLLGLSLFIVMLSLNQGKTNILYGVVLIINFLAYIFTIIFP